jgi:hypothetical protein
MSTITLGCFPNHWFLCEIYREVHRATSFDSPEPCDASLDMSSDYLHPQTNGTPTYLQLLQDPVVRKTSQSSVQSARKTSQSSIHSSLRCVPKHRFIYGAMSTALRRFPNHWFIYGAMSTALRCFPNHRFIYGAVTTALGCFPNHRFIYRAMNTALRCFSSRLYRTL